MKQKFHQWLAAATVFIIIMWGAAAFAASEQDIVAANFLKFLRSDKRIVASEVLQGNRLDTNLPPVPIAHLYHLEGGGYLLIATAKSLTPVKAYSLTSDFDGLPPNYRAALLDEMEALNRDPQGGGGRTIQSAADLENQSRWDFLLSLDGARLPLAYTADTWLIKTKWNQGSPYNKFTPRVNGQATWAGCVNTALAQVLRYHRYPATSKGVVSYVWNSQTLKAILYRSYNWDNMPEVLDASTPDHQVDEAARLIADLGIANNTNFGLSGSGASMQTGVLTENFGYSTTLQRLYNTDVNAFFAQLKTEIDAERPVLLSFSGSPGHMVVADGYASDPSGRNIHINMGWGGSQDNFYFLDQTVLPESYNFQTTAGNLYIYHNIKPCSGGDCAVNLETGDAATGLSLAGTFNAAEDADRYDIYLKGATTIRGSRGYSTLGFYIYLYNKADGSETYVVQGNATANVDIPAGSLPAGKYTVKIGLCNNSGSCYPYPTAAGKDQYVVMITSGTPTDEEKAAIDQSIDIPPVINNDLRDILLSSTNPSTYRILIDARDENGDALTLQVTNTKPSAFAATLTNNILEITPVAGVTGIAGKTTVKATANGKSAEKSFVVMVSNETVGFGKAFEVKGIFANQDAFNLHKVILDGACTIAGDRGYSNQAFYSSVQDSVGNFVIGPGDSTISSTFTRNRYVIGASLKNPGIGQYTYNQNDKYTLTVNCPNADDSATTIAGLLGIDLSGLQSWTGDINGDGTVTLADAILALQIAAGIAPPAGSIQAGYNPTSADVNGDGKIGIAEVIYILQITAGTR